MLLKTNERVDILVVDDREDGLLAIEALLGENPVYNLVMAHSGIEALRLLPKHDFSMILLDVQMPDLDGFQTAELVRRQARYNGIAIIFITAINKDDRYVYRGYESGAVDYLFKPFDPVILKSKVAVFAQLHLKERQIREQALRLTEQESIGHRARVQALEIEGLNRYRSLADAIPHMVWRTTNVGELDYCNDLWSSYTGTSQLDCQGLNWRQSVHPEDLQILLDQWTVAMAQGETFEVEARIRRHDGIYRWHWVKGVSEKGPEGHVKAWLGTCTDIHDRKLFERKLIEAQRQAEEANQAKTQFLANVSHEIRTPLNAIIGFTELMLDPDCMVEERQNNLSIVRRNGQQLLKIINEVLDISKVEAGGLEIERIETNLASLIAGIKSSMSVIAIKKGIKLEFRVRDKIPEEVWTDSTRLHQILLNIVGNALKFTSQGSVQITAEYFGEIDRRSILRFTVCDTGVGVDATAAQKIFTPFTQADSSTTRIFGGTGLGLALARKLARALGGDIWLDKSEPDKGSSFVVEIEAALVDETAWINRFSDVSDDSEAGNETHSKGELVGAKILLVEDAKDNQILISCFLQNSGAHIDIANNGKEGVEMALANDYSLVLMDIQMPFLDGYEATSRLRQAGFKAPIIALTAHALNEERDKCLRVGCNAHLTKPITRQHLIDSVARHLEPRGSIKKLEALPKRPARDLMTGQN